MEKTLKFSLKKHTKYNKTKSVYKALFSVSDTSPSKSGKCRLLTVVPTNYLFNYEEKKEV